MKASKQAILSLLDGPRTLKELKQLHALMISTTLIADTIPLSRLIDSLADPDSGDLRYARSIFLRVPRPSLYMWNSVTRGLSCSKEPLSALLTYKDLLSSGLSPDNFTFPFAFKACARVLDRKLGQCVHGRVVKTGYEADVYVSTTLIHMYNSCGDMSSAKTVFDAAATKNAVGWTSMIAGYVANGQAREAIELYREMELAGAPANDITMVHVLVACAQARDLDTGRSVHCRLRRSQFDPIRSNVVVATAILSMYAQCGHLRAAQVVFEGMQERNEVSWNAMIGAYKQHRRSDELLSVFAAMRRSGIGSDKVAALSLLGVCGDKGALSLGQGVHAYVEKISTSRDVAIGTSLVDMYAKAGDTGSALQAFNCIEEKDVLAWTSMITGLAMHGDGEKALDMFGEMEAAGVSPDRVTFIGVMSACRHTGKVDEGRKYFESMRTAYGISPMIEHYGCMAYLLSRAGQFAEAERLVMTMPMRPSIIIWSAILSGCEIHGHVGVAERMGDRIAEFNPRASGVYVLLSNIYAGAGSWQGVERARELMRHKGIEKVHGTSSVEVKVSCL